MLEPWKDLNLLAPPVQTSRNVSDLDVNEIEHVCAYILKVLRNQSPLHRESALLSRLVYKYDKKFRNDIGFRYIRKIASTLRKYLLLNLVKDIDNFKSVLPQDNDDFLPTRQMLEYILIRIMTFSNLMLRICVCSKQASLFYLNRIKRGESHWMSLMPFAVLSRIWSLAKVLLKHSAVWYSHLHPCLLKFPPKGLQFLPFNYELPNNLEKWLDLTNLEFFGKFEWTIKKNYNFNLTSLDDDDDVNVFDKILNYVNDLNDKEKRDTVVIQTKEDMVMEAVTPTAEKVDFGEVISRDTLNVLSDFQKKVKKEPVICHYFNKVNDVKSLNNFLAKEELFRNDNNCKQSLTGHLSFMQWQTLKNSLIKVCNTASNKRTIERKLQKMWKDKCLVYLQSH